MSFETATSAPKAPCTPTHQRVTRLRPAVELLEQPGEFVMQVVMPGVAPEQVDVSVERNIVTVQGEATPQIPEGLQRISGDSGRRRYERSFQLSDDIDRSAIDAEMKHGILTLRFPKAQQARKASIPVKGT